MGMCDSKQLNIMLLLGLVGLLIVGSSFYKQNGTGDEVAGFIQQNQPCTYDKDFGALDVRLNDIKRILLTPARAVESKSSDATPALQKEITEIRSFLQKIVDSNVAEKSTKYAQEQAAVSRELRNELSAVKLLLQNHVDGDAVEKVGNPVVAAPAVGNLNGCPFSPPSTTVQHNGGWMYTKKLIRAEHVTFDSGVGKALIEYLGKTTLYDIGAGVGQLEFFLKKMEAPIDISSFDGGNNIMNMWDQNTPLRQDKDYVVPHVCWIDASKPVKLPPREWVISIEVGEHIDKAFEQTFIDNLVGAASKGVIVTWAIVGQGGYQHINTQNNPYIIEQFENRGLRYDKVQSEYLRTTVRQNLWLRKTIMVFLK